jgi:hypothetical protein
MARFKGRAETRSDLFVPAVTAALLIILLVFLIWFLVNPVALRAHFGF